MTRDVFSRLCFVLQNSGGLKASRNTSVGEQVAMFLSILAHHTKNRIVKSKYMRSGRTVSKYFHRVLNAIIKLHKLLLARPNPIDDDCNDNRWKFFKTRIGICPQYKEPQLVEKLKYRDDNLLCHSNLHGRHLHKNLKWASAVT
ncbi:hypothetical protein ACS0TY_012597 [Phlomoides rotata]